MLYYLPQNIYKAFFFNDNVPDQYPLYSNLEGAWVLVDRFSIKKNIFNGIGVENYGIGIKFHPFPSISFV